MPSQIPESAHSNITNDRETNSETPPPVTPHPFPSTYPSGLELVLDAVLEPLALDLHRSEHQAGADKVGRVADALAGLEAVQVGLFSLDVHRVDGVQTEPGGESPAVLVGPSCQRWNHDRLRVGQGQLRSGQVRVVLGIMLPWGSIMIGSHWLKRETKVVKKHQNET